MKNNFFQNIDLGLSYDDVLLVPSMSKILSRADVNLKTSLGFIDSSIPFLPANMNSISESEMIDAFCEINGIAAFHRYFEPADLLEKIKKLSIKSQGRWGISVGVNKIWTEDLMKRIQSEISEESYPLFAIIDVAHGHHTLVLKTIEEIKSNYPFLKIIAGNVCTHYGAAELASAGADVIKVGVGPGCFAAGTRILMSNGKYRNIEDIVPGDQVINMYGKSVSVKRSFCTGKRKVSRLRHSCFYGEMIMTPDHKFYIGDLSTISQKTLKSYGYRKALFRPDRKGDSKKKWRDIHSSKKDCLLTPSNIEFDFKDSFEIKLSEYCISERNEKQNITVKPSYDLGYIIGFFLGDGCARILDNGSGAVHFYLGINEEDFAQKISNSMKLIFNQNVKKNIRDNVLIISAYSVSLAKFFSSFYSDNTKVFPENFFCNDLSYLKGVMDGLVDSDGHISKEGRICFKNSSLDLIELFCVVCKKITGSFPNIEKTCKNYESSKLIGYDCKEVNHCRLSKTHKARDIGDGHSVVKILNYEETDDHVLTYDIEIDDESHSFIANNVIVHNSACTTRIVTGCGYPQLSAVKNISDYFFDNDINIPIIADGGIRYSGDAVKAIAAGASMVMVGNMLAGTDETPGEFDSEGYKCYQGMASSRAQAAFYGKDQNQIAEEGTWFKIAAKGSVKNIILKVKMGMASGFSYCGCENIKQMQEYGKHPDSWIRVTSRGMAEGHPHGIWKGAR